MLFTYDKRFRNDRLTTARRMEAHQHLTRCLGKNGLHENQIDVLEGSKHYVPESAAILHRFLSISQIPLGCVIFSDKGNAFRDHNGPVIPQYHDARTFTYPPLIHHIISPNDNHFHGAAKAKWRAMYAKMGWGSGDAVESDLCLLGYLTHTDPRAIQGYFERNLFLGQEPPTAKRCRTLFEHIPTRKTPPKLFFEECTIAHREA